MAVTKNSIEHVVEDGLCHRCGACLPICPVSKCITFDERLYPQVNSNTCIECGLCERVCSGDKVELESLKNTLVGAVASAKDSSLGGFHQPWICHATDRATRAAGASGGLVTQLLIHLIESDEIDAAIVAGMNPDKPSQVSPMLARSPDEIRAAAGSKYTVAPMVTAMQHVLRSGRRNEEQRYAFVGVACHVHSLRMMMSKLNQARRRIRCVIGPLCKSAFDPEATDDLLRANKIEVDGLSQFEFRGGAWPGVMRARTTDGRYHRLHQTNFRDGAYNYLMSLYTQPRCHLCYDFGNELADLTVGDPWSRDATGKYTHEGGHTLAIPRTETGLWLVDVMRQSSDFRIEPAPEDAIRFHQGAAKAKQSLVQVRVSALSRQNRPVPKYDRELPQTNLLHRLKSRLFLLTLHLGKTPLLRYWVLKILVSRPGVVLVYFRQWRKFGVRGMRKVNRLTGGREEENVTKKGRVTRSNGC